jgi:hypothetical protein
MGRYTAPLAFITKTIVVKEELFQCNGGDLESSVALEASC